MQPKSAMSYRRVGHVIFNLQLGVGHVFSNHHILNCSDPPPYTFWPVPKQKYKKNASACADVQAVPTSAQASYVYRLNL